MTNQKYDKKVETEAVELNDEQLDGVSGELVNVVESPDKGTAQNNDKAVKNTNLLS